MYAGSEWQLPHNCGICLRSILPFHPALRLMALSASSLVGSPPWQLAQVKPLGACMSWLNFSWLTPRGSGNAEWQSKHEFVVCPHPRLAESSKRPAGKSKRARPSNRMLLREIPINTHSCPVGKSKDGNSSNPALGA